MGKLGKMAFIGLALTFACVAGNAQSQSISSAQSIDDYVKARFGEGLKILGPATIASPQAKLELNARSFPTTLISVPVAYKAIGHLDQDLTFTVVPGGKPQVVPKGTPMFRETFRRTDTDIFEAWCFVQSQHAFAGTFYYNNCIAKTSDGKAVVYYDPGYSYQLGVTSMFDARGEQGTHGMYWYAFSLVPGGSDPVDYPAISEIDTTSPKMTLELRVQVMRFGKSDPYFISYWALKGPDGFRPGAGILAEQWLQVDDATVSMDLGKTDVKFDYDIHSKTLSNVRLDTGAEAPKCNDQNYPSVEGVFGLFQDKDKVMWSAAGLHPEQGNCYAR